MPLLRLALAALSLCLAASGCQRGGDGALKVVVIGDTEPTLGNPLAAPATEADAVLRSAIAQGLVRFDATGQIESGLAERWNVSDDGLSYIFRLAEGEWHDGPRINAHDVAKMLTRAVRASPDDPARDSLGAINEIVAMTDRVIEIRLRAPRPNLLTILAQPEFALIRGGAGTGPFGLRPAKGGESAEGSAPLLLRRRLPGFDGEEGSREDLSLAVMPAAAAIAAFRDERADIVLGGTIADLPLAQRAKLDRGALRFDPAAGLFGLVPTRISGFGGNEQLRRVLSEAIDRPALIAALGITGLVPRATILQQGLAGLGAPPQPGWLAQPLDQRRAALLSAVERALEAPRGAVQPAKALTVGLPDGPGGDLLLARLKADWGAIGFSVTRAGKNERADFRLLDLVAPSDSPAWFVRRFRCVVAAVCLPELEAVLASARETADPRQRAALLGGAAQKMDASVLFIPLTAPIRWSLVGRSAPGFTENRYARHALGSLAASAQGSAK